MELFSYKWSNWCCNPSYRNWRFEAAPNLERKFFPDTRCCHKLNILGFLLWIFSGWFSGIIQALLSIFFYASNFSQPRSQGLSSSRPSLAPGGGKMRDPGNEVDLHIFRAAHSGGEGGRKTEFLFLTKYVIEFAELFLVAILVRNHKKID